MSVTFLINNLQIGFTYHYNFVLLHIRSNDYLLHSCTQCIPFVRHFQYKYSRRCKSSSRKLSCVQNGKTICRISIPTVTVYRKCNVHLFDGEYERLNLVPLSFCSKCGRLLHAATKMRWLLLLLLCWGQY